MQRAWNNFQTTLKKKQTKTWRLCLWDLLKVQFTICKETFQSFQNQLIHLFPKKTIGVPSQFDIKLFLINILRSSRNFCQFPVKALHWALRKLVCSHESYQRFRPLDGKKIGKYLERKIYRNSKCTTNMAKKTKLNLTSRHLPFKLKSLGERKDHPRLLFTFPKDCQSICAADLFRKASPSSCNEFIIKMNGSMS